jgi:hypothetical protein
MASKYIKKSSTSLVIKEMQIKTTLRFHLTPVRMARIKGINNNEGWRGCGKIGTLIHCWWECKLVQPLWKTVWRFFKKLELEQRSTDTAPRHQPKRTLRQDTIESFVHRCSSQQYSQQPSSGNNLDALQLMNGS